MFVGLTRGCFTPGLFEFNEDDDAISVEESVGIIFGFHAADLPAEGFGMFGNFELNVGFIQGRSAFRFNVLGGRRLADLCGGVE